MGNIFWHKGSSAPLSSFARARALYTIFIGRHNSRQHSGTLGTSSRCGLYSRAYSHRAIIDPRMSVWVVKLNNLSFSDLPTNHLCLLWYLVCFFILCYCPSQAKVSRVHSSWTIAQNNERQQKEQKCVSDRERNILNFNWQRESLKAYIEILTYPVSSLSGAQQTCLVYYSNCIVDINTKKAKHKPA